MRRPLERLRTGQPKNPQSGRLLYFIAGDTGISMLDLRPNRGLAKQIREFAKNRPVEDGYARRKSAMRERGKRTCTR